MELLASGDSDLGEAKSAKILAPRYKSPSRSAPSVTGARAGENPPAVQRWPGSQGDAPVRSSPGPRGLMTGPGSGGDPSGGTHLTGPRKESPSRSAPSVTGARAGENPPAVQRWPDSQGDTPVRSSPGPRGLMTGPGSGGDPSGGAHVTGPRIRIPQAAPPRPVTGARSRRVPGGGPTLAPILKGIRQSAPPPAREGLPMGPGILRRPVQVVHTLTVPKHPPQSTRQVRSEAGIAAGPRR